MCIVTDNRDCTVHRDCVQCVVLGRPIPTVNRKAVATYVQITPVIDRKANYSLRIEILAYPPAFEASVRGVPVGIDNL